MLVGDAATICSDRMLGSLYDYACECGTVLFVQQLLDDDGQVPPDPAAVDARRAPQAQKRLNKDKAKREGKEKQDRLTRERFERQLSELRDRGGHLEFPASLNSFERALCHEVAEALGLEHESRGEGGARHFCVWTAGSAPPPAGPSPATSGPSEGLVAGSGAAASSKAAQPAPKASSNRQPAEPAEI